MRHVVNALLVREGTVMLARRAPHRTAYPALWSFPGGHVEANETLDEALVREMREEIGVIPISYRTLGTLSAPDADPADPVTYHMFVVTTWDFGEPAMAGDEHTALRWFTFATAATLRDLALEAYRPLFLTLAGLDARQLT